MSEDRSLFVPKVRRPAKQLKELQGTSLYTPSSLAQVYSDWPSQSRDYLWNILEDYFFSKSDNLNDI